MNQFTELPLCSVLQANLSRHGFVRPTPVQAEAIPPALAGKDVVATAQTGTGKTLGFLVPVLDALAQHPQKGVKAVVLSPTRELAIQISETFAKLASNTGVHAAVVVGGLNEKSQLRKIRDGAQLLIATPGRLCDFLDRGLTDLSGVRFVVLDEADRMLDMGFLPPLRRILKEMPRDRQTLFFSATIEKSVAHLVDSHVRNPVRISVGSTSKPHEKVNLHWYEVEHERKFSLLVRLLKQEEGSFLVFARTKHGVDRLARNLSAAGLKATRIHGDRTQNQRNEALRGFKENRYRILVATDVAARGIHVDGIGHVVNYDLPQVAEDFIHRVGRTGRAGALGTATTFSTQAERQDIRNLERTLKVRLEKQAVDEDMEIVKPAPNAFYENALYAKSEVRAKSEPRRRFARPEGRPQGRKTASRRRG